MPNPLPKRPFAEFRASLFARGVLDGVSLRCREGFVRLEDIYSDSKTKSIVAARAAIWCWMYDELKFSFPEIAQVWDREHTTVMAAVKRHRKRPLAPLAGATSAPSVIMGMDVSPKADSTAYVLAERLPNGKLRILSTDVPEELIRKARR